ncbi:hypothetical protein U6G28_00280 [Actinomycetaceae bacterium MB13-C1-2]|nr:hypothetical protein U6G28_00280 [Actinomycetaceae bacterium MB13-C1-2]
MNHRKPLIAAASVAALLGLSACSPPVLEVEESGSHLQSGPDQSGSQSGAQSGESSVALTDEQTERIVAEVQAAVDLSDKEKSAEPLAERLVNPALDMRAGQLTRAEKTSTELAPLIIGNAVHSATVGNSFPRVLVVASEASGDDPAEVFFLTQKDAKSDYMLENWARLIGGTPVKGLSVRDGSTVVDGSTTGLKVTPSDAVATYVNFLNNPDNEEYQLFEDNSFEPRYREERSALSDAVKVAGTVSTQAREWDAPVIGVLLETGNALVSSSFKYTETYTKTVEGSTFELSGTPAAFMDDPKVDSTVTVDYQVNIFFLIPPEDSDDPIAVVGAERVIQGVKKG